MRFEDLIGQKEVGTQLKRELEGGRSAHAYLIHGPPGSGHLPFAWGFATALFCQRPERGEACGYCNNCQRIAKLAHPDLHLSFPFIKRSGQQENSDPLQSFFRETLLKNPFISLEQWLKETGEANKQGVIPVAESERILENLSLKAYEGGKKLILIWMAEKLNPDAANKLLKILEEPPPDSIFVLLAEDPSSILPTIRSRTRMMSLRPLSDEDVAKNLQRWSELDAASAERIAGPSDGNLSLAMEIALQGANGEYFQQFAEWMRTCFKGNLPEGLEWVEAIAGKGREWHKGFLVYGLHILRQCMIHNLVDGSRVRLSEEEKAFEEKFRYYVPESVTSDLSKIFEEACADIERNGNPRIVFFDITLQLVDRFRNSQSKKGTD